MAGQSPTEDNSRPGGGGANEIFFYLGGLRLSFGGVGGSSFHLGGLECFFYLGGFNPPGEVGQITGGVGQITRGVQPPNPRGNASTGPSTGRIMETCRRSVADLNLDLNDERKEVAHA